MQDIISLKLKEYQKLRAGNRELRVWLERSDLWYWLYSALKINDMPLEKGKIVDILDGQIVEDASIDVYNFIHGYYSLYKMMKSDIEMDVRPDLKVLSRWLAELYQESPEYRTNNPVVYEWNHIPPHFDEVRGYTDVLMRKARCSTVADMAVLHLDFVKNYPYAEKTVPAGLVLLSYELLKAGYPLPSLSANDIEYNEMVDAYVNEGDAEPFVSMLERSVLNRLESVLLICRQAAEIDDK